jgi:predicted PhzF superfamily epimerase YddE/YHI9
MRLPFFQIDAFARVPLTGNPAAVMPLDRWLDDAQMQAIAAENNLSETAFTVPSESADADYDLRWFTPTVEVDLCGHATIAAGHVLMDGGRVRFATRSGILTVSRAGETFVGREGNGSAIVMLEDEAAVRSVNPDFAALRKIDRLVIVTAPGERHDIASRVFAAYHGIDEDPVTGAAHAALVPLWAKRLGRDSFTALQASKRTGELHCRLAGDRVVLGGRCISVIVGHFEL